MQLLSRHRPLARLARPVRCSTLVQPIRKMKSFQVRFERFFLDQSLPEELKFANPFAKELPGDPESENKIRQVYDAFYSFIDPTPTQTESRLIAYSKEVCEILELGEAEMDKPETKWILSGQQTLPQSYVSQKANAKEFLSLDGATLNVTEGINLETLFLFPSFSLIFILVGRSIG